MGIKVLKIGWVFSTLDKKKRPAHEPVRTRFISMGCMGIAYQINEILVG